MGSHAAKCSMRLVPIGAEQLLRTERRRGAFTCRADDDRSGVLPRFGDPDIVVLVGEPGKGVQVEYGEAASWLLYLGAGKKAKVWDLGPSALFLVDAAEQLHISQPDVKTSFHFKYPSFSLPSASGSGLLFLNRWTFCYTIA